VVYHNLSSGKGNDCSRMSIIYKKIPQNAGNIDFDNPPSADNYQVNDFNNDAQRSGKGIVKLIVHVGKATSGKQVAPFRQGSRNMALTLDMNGLVLRPWQNTPQKLNTIYAWKTPQLSQERSIIIDGRSEKPSKLSNILRI